MQAGLFAEMSRLETVNVRHQRSGESVSEQSVTVQTSTYGSHDEQGRGLHFGCFRRETSEMFGFSRECSRSLGGKRVTLCETSAVSAESSRRSFGFFRKTSKTRGRGDRVLHIGCFRYACFRPFRPFFGNLAISRSRARVRVLF